MRFFTSFAKAFYKKADNLKTEVALHYVHYDVVGIHMDICLSWKIKLGIYQIVLFVDKLDLFMIKYSKIF